jgi:hypothetical protein
MTEMMSAVSWHLGLQILCAFPQHSSQGQLVPGREGRARGRAPYSQGEEEQGGDDDARGGDVVKGGQEAGGQRLHQPVGEHVVDQLEVGEGPAVPARLQDNLGRRSARREADQSVGHG